MSNMLLSKCHDIPVEELITSFQTFFPFSRNHLTKFEISLPSYQIVPFLARSYIFKIDVADIWSLGIHCSRVNITSNTLTSLQSMIPLVEHKWHGVHEKIWPFNFSRFQLIDSLDAPSTCLGRVPRYGGLISRRLLMTIS